MIRTNTRSRRHAPRRATFALCAVLMISASLPLVAQRWTETLGGGDPAGEEGRAVIEAANGDIITAGTAHSATGQPLAYVVRLDANGTLLWHYIYDVENSGRCGAADIKEYPNGDLAVVGWSMYPAGDRAFAMRLDANGTVLWISHFQTSLSSWAHSVVIATQGNGITTNPDDLILGGTMYYSNGTPNGNDGLLARLDANGNPIWIKTYDLSLPGTTYNDELIGIDEATITGAGDVVATGSSTDPVGTMSVWVLRVDGNTGATNTPPQGSAVFTTPTLVQASGHAIIELRNGTFNGDLAITGVTNNTMNSSDVLALQITSDPCDPTNPRALRRLGEFVKGSADEGFDLCEITGPAIGTVGNVMVTGYTKVTGNVEAFLQEFQVGTMIAVGNMYYYGSTGDEIGYSVAETPNAPVTPGYAVAGYTTSPALMAPGNTKDEYVFKVNGTLNNVCYYERINPPTDTTYLNVTCTPAIETSYLDTLLQLQPTITPGWTANLVCFASPKVRTAPSSTEAGISDLSVHPTPSGRGAAISLGYALKADARVDIIVSDMVGRVIHRSRAEQKAGRIAEEVSTAGWPAGSYVARVVADGCVRTARIVVTER